MKTVKIEDEIWQSLMELKIKHKKRSIGETIWMLLESKKGET